MKKLFAMLLVLSLMLSLPVCGFAAADIETLIMEASAGNSQAMNDLGMAYYEGTLLSKNYSKAMEWLQKAADAGETDCYYTIGMIYEKGGDGIKQNMDAAMSWYNKAADLGDEDAKLKLGLVTKKSEPTIPVKKSEPTWVRLDGVFGDPELIRTSKTSGLENPFYLDSPVQNCRHVKLSLAVEEKQGICTGYYYLFVKDVENNWHHTASFRLRDYHINGDPVVFDLDLDTNETFVAVALWPADSGMDFTAIFDYAVYVDPSCVTEYSSSIPRPRFTESNVNCAVISLHFKTQAWRDPYAAYIDFIQDYIIGYDRNGNVWIDIGGAYDEMEHNRLHPDELP